MHNRNETRRGEHLFRERYAAACLEFSGNLAETMAISFFDPNECRVKEWDIAVNKFKACVRLKIGVGMEVGDLDWVDGVKLAANYYINFSAFRGRLTGHISIE